MSTKKFLSFHQRASTHHHYRHHVCQCAAVLYHMQYFSNFLATFTFCVCQYFYSCFLLFCYERLITMLIFCNTRICEVGNDIFSKSILSHYIIIPLLFFLCAQRIDHLTLMDAWCIWFYHCCDLKARSEVRKGMHSLYLRLAFVFPFVFKSLATIFRDISPFFKSIQFSFWTMQESEPKLTVASYFDWSMLALKIILLHCKRKK